MDEIFFGGQADPVYERLFCSLYELPTPALPLGQIMHWSSMLDAWGLGGHAIQEQRVLVASGFFYGIHSPTPTPEQIREAEERARTLGCDWVLYPLLRRDSCHALGDHGFESIPWFVESEYRVEQGVDADLAAQLGLHTAKNIRRLARKAEAEFDLELHWPRREDGDVAIRTFEDLHWENLNKYGHRRNTHGKEQLAILQDSPFAENVLVCLRREKAERKACVQASLNLVSADAGVLLMVVQGMRRDLIDPSHNLYQAETYQLYRWGADNGIKVFNLGRGGAASKAMLGCNHFYVLDHLLKPISARASRAALEPIRERASAFVSGQLAAIAEKRSRKNFWIHQ